MLADGTLKTSTVNSASFALASHNHSIADIDADAKQNAQIASETNIVAQQSSDIAQKIVNNANNKKFDGKDDVIIRKQIIDINYLGDEKRKIEQQLKKL